MNTGLHVQQKSAKPPAKVIAPASPLYVLDSAAGMASNQVHRIASDGLSRIWMATPVGLARFDGSFIQQWDRHTGLQCNGLRCVAIDGEATVWIGTDLGFDRLDVSGQPLPGAAQGSWHRGLCQHIDVSTVNPWIGTAQGLVKLERCRDMAGYQIAYSADIGFVSDIKCLDTQRVFAASTGGGLVETDGQTWWSYRSEELIGRQITRIALGHHGELLVGTDNGLYVIDDSSGKVTARLRRSHVDPAVTAIAVDADRYWVAYGKTVMGYAIGALSTTAVECYSVDSPVNDLLPDNLGNIFIATNNSGLAMVSCLRQAVQRIDLGREGGIYSIKAGSVDSFTIGGDNIFGKIVLPSDTSVLPPDESGGHAGAHAWDALAHMALSSQGWHGLPDTTVWDSIDDGANIWVATQAGLYRAPHGGAFALVHERDPILGAPNRVLMQRDHGLWVGTLHGLVCIRGGHAEPVDGGGAPLGYVYTLYLGVC